MTSSLIIPSRNRPKLLAETVQSVLQGDEVPTEIIIVDQSDAPNPVLENLATDRPCHVRYLWRTTPGVSRARNEGVAAAMHNVIVMIDDDVLVTPSWFGAITKALVDFGPDCVVTGQVLPAQANNSDGFEPS